MCAVKKTAKGLEIATAANLMNGPSTCMSLTRVILALRTVTMWTVAPKREVDPEEGDAGDSYVRCCIKST